MLMKVDFSSHFFELLGRLSDEEQKLLSELTFLIEECGLHGLPGRNKTSNDFPDAFLGKKRIDAERFVQKNKLWHYHVGYLTYRKKNQRGDWTSEFVVHYQKISNSNIRFVHYSSHRPSFRNPLPQYLV